MGETTDKNEITLEFPLTLPDGTVVEKLTLRRAKVRDMKAAQRRGDTPEEREIALFALLCTPALAPEDLEGMDLADYGQLQRHFQGMVRGSGGYVEGGGAAGAVV